MNRSADPLIIPARVTAKDLAKRIDREVSQIQAVLRARQQPDTPDEVIGADLAIEVCKVLGVSASVESRDLALERLYEFETRGEMGYDVGGRAGEIIDGVVTGLDDLDEMIESVAERWSVARMPVVDRNILRIGAYELRSSPTIPTAVVVSEAVRMAQTYSTERSGSFVNGVLATLATTLR